MNLKETYTKVFLKQAGISINESTLKEYMPKWWQNTRAKKTGGLRLTEDGFAFTTETLELANYEVPFPDNFKVTTQIVIFLDKFIDCPYYLTNRSVSVLNEKKALELHLFSGDVRKYGLNKALKRTNDSINP
jgi:hypothetical protein|tara:strand:+ start:1417 stop:1812 length:396 start_codon:yes stop_codon:yes gene_type:complete